MAENEARRIKTADRLLDVFEALHELGPIGVTDLSNHTGIPKSTLYQYLMTLEDRGFVVKNDDVYTLSARLLGYGMKVRGQMSLYETSIPYIDELAETTGEIAWLVIEEHGLCVTLDRAFGERAMKKFGGLVGGLTELHSHAAGKAVLAFLPEERVYEIIKSHGLGGYTDETIQEQSELLEELTEIRDRGYAFNDNETVEGLRAVAAPILTESRIVGAISVGGPQTRFRGDYYRNELPELVTGVANEIELQISTPSPW